VSGGAGRASRANRCGQHASSVGPVPSTREALPTPASCGHHTACKPLPCEPSAEAACSGYEPLPAGDTAWPPNHTPCPPALIPNPRTPSYSLLHVAAGLGHSRCLKLLMDSGLSPAGPGAAGGPDGATPLHAAALAGSLECAEALLAKGEGAGSVRPRLRPAGMARGQAALHSCRARLHGLPVQRTRFPHPHRPSPPHHPTQAPTRWPLPPTAAWRTSASRPPRRSRRRRSRSSCRRPPTKPAKPAAPRPRPRPRPRPLLQPRRPRQRRRAPRPRPRRMKGGEPTGRRGPRAMPRCSAGCLTRSRSGASTASRAWQRRS
jgi:hypothetical protein